MFTVLVAAGSAGKLGVAFTVAFADTPCRCMLTTLFVPAREVELENAPYALISRPSLPEIRQPHKLISSLLFDASAAPPLRLIPPAA
jgi:hypothetical protein